MTKLQSISIASTVHARSKSFLCLIGSVKSMHFYSKIYVGAVVKSAKVHDVI